MKVILMRGLPGSGKSTWVNHCVQHHGTNNKKVVVCSADDSHTLPDGTYKFYPANVAKAHNDCLKKFLTQLDPFNPDALRNCNPLTCVIVDNTNTSAWEIAPYLRLAEAFGHEVKIVRVECSLQLATSRGVHGVPTKTMLAMQRNLLTEVLPSHWREEVVFSDQPFHNTEFMA